jgi:ribonuclease PH
MRALEFTPDFIPSADGSVLACAEQTRVICTATIDDKVPPFLRGRGQGWLSAEYDMLPAAGNVRKRRAVSAGKPDGRSLEIQRLIGRSIRSAVQMDKLGERTIWLDCDVIQADGGTRTTSINGAMVSTVMALRKLRDRGAFETLPLNHFIGAISVGIIDGEVIVDLDYAKDSNAETDMNLVMTEDGEFIEIQGTAERKPFTASELSTIIERGSAAIVSIISQQKKVLGYVEGE